MTQTQCFAAVFRRTISLLILCFALVSMAAAQVRAWGNNTAGELNVPPSLTGAVAIAVCGQHALALKSDGTVVGWGYNLNGESNVPAGLAGVSAVAAGVNHSMAFKTDRSIRCWGDNIYGQCNVPAGLTGVTAIAAGGFHSLALKSDGTVWGWGRNDSGQSSAPWDLGGVTAIAGGAYHSIALKSDGTVRCWGSNISGQCNIPSGLSDVVAIGAGFSHSMAVKSNGTVVCWGDNSLGQCNVPAGLSGVKAVTGGYGHSMALKTDGTVVCWGYNGKNQCNVPAGLNGVSAIGGGLYHSVALIPPSITLKANRTDFIAGSTSTVTGTVTFSDPTAIKETVPLSSSDSHVVVPASFVIRAGSTTATFRTTHSPVTVPTDVVVTAHLASGALVMNVHLEPLVVKSLVLTPKKGEGSSSFTAVVSLNANPAAPVTVLLNSNDSSAPVPASIQASADLPSRTFTIDSLEVAWGRDATIDASFGGVTKSAVLTLYAKPKIKAFSFSQGTAFGNQKIQGKIALDIPARAGGATVSIALGTGLTSVSSIAIAEGQRTASFDIFVDDISLVSTPNVTVSTTYSTFVKSVTIKPLVVTSVSLSPTSVKGGDSSSVTVTISGVVAMDTVVDLSSSISDAQVPATLTIPAGASSATAIITTTAVTGSRFATIQAGRKGTSKSQSLTINP